jgi:hypothetical protein
MEAAKAVAVYDWKAELQKVQEGRRALIPTPRDSWVKTDDGVFEVYGIKAPELTAVVTGWSNFAVYYEKAYDPKVKAPPVCWGLNAGLAEHLRPAENVPKPQHTLCLNCPHGQFGTAPNGSGKRCHQGKRLAVLIVKQQSDGHYLALPGYLKIPANSIKEVDSLLYRVEVLSDRPIYSVTVRLTLDPDVNYTKFLFDRVAVIEDEGLGNAVLERLKDPSVRERLLQGFEYAQPEEEADVRY